MKWLSKQDRVSNKNEMKWLFQSQGEGNQGIEVAKNQPAGNKISVRSHGTFGPWSSQKNCLAWLRFFVDLFPVKKISQSIHPSWISESRVQVNRRLFFRKVWWTGSTFFATGRYEKPFLRSNGLRAPGLFDSPKKKTKHPFVVGLRCGNKFHEQLEFRTVQEPR